MANRMLQRGVEDVTNNYIAQPKDHTLASLLEEAFVLLEMRFANFGSCPAPFSRMHAPPSQASARVHSFLVSLFDARRLVGCALAHKPAMGCALSRPRWGEHFMDPFPGREALRCDSLPAPRPRALLPDFSPRRPPACGLRFVLSLMSDVYLQTTANTPWTRRQGGRRIDAPASMRLPHRPPHVCIASWFPSSTPTCLWAALYPLAKRCVLADHVANTDYSPWTHRLGGRRIDALPPQPPTRVHCWFPSSTTTGLWAALHPLAERWVLADTGR